MKLRTIVLVMTVLALMPFVCAQNAPRPANPVTEISADLGPCSAEFHVTDMNGNGIYNAKIHTLIRYGFMGLHKLGLDAGTNSDGRARFIKLPAELKKPVEFTISDGSDRETLSFHPSVDCHAHFEVPLKKK